MIPVIIISACLAISVAALVVLPLVSGRGREESRADRDAAIYRDQIAELDRDVARGLIAPQEAESTRAEIARRLITADGRARRSEGFGPAPRSTSAKIAGAALVTLPLLAIAIYAFVGAPGAPDRPFDLRPAAERQAGLQGLPAEMRMRQAEAERVERERAGPVTAPQSEDARRHAELIERLEQVVAERPEDIEGRRLLVDGYMRQNRFSEAAAVLAEIATLKGPRAGADLFAERAEALVLAAGGYVSPEAETAIRRALAIDQSLPMARYYAALAMAQQGQVDRAVFIWERLRAEAPSDAPWLPMVEQVLAEVRRERDGAPGPSAADMAAAETMTAAEREEMIRGMVEGLESRLDEDGGGPEEWVRLIRAHDRLGDRDAARRAYERSQSALSGSEAGFVREQALVMGVIEE